DGVGGVAGAGRRGDLAPADGAVGALHPHEHVLEVGLAVGAGLDLVHQRQAHLQQLDPVDAHLSVSVRVDAEPRGDRVPAGEAPPGALGAGGGEGGDDVHDGGDGGGGVGVGGAVGA